MAIEVVIGLLVLVLAVGTTAAMFIGLAGIFGVMILARCEQCGRLDMAAASDMSRPCMYCRHEQLFHPVALLRHTYVPH
ncbi:MAG: hypothetical protein ACR2KJ_19140 [Jatrophihabitans sp.]